MRWLFIFLVKKLHWWLIWKQFLVVFSLAAIWWVLWLGIWRLLLLHYCMRHLLRLLVSYSVRRSEGSLLSLNGSLVGGGAIPVLLSGKAFNFLLDLWLDEVLLLAGRRLLSVQLHLQQRLLVRWRSTIWWSLNLRLGALLLCELILELELVHNLLIGRLLRVGPLLTVLRVQTTRALALLLSREVMCTSRINDRALLHASVLSKLANHVLRVLRKREMLLVSVTSWPIRLLCTLSKLLLLQDYLAVQVTFRSLWRPSSVDLVCCKHELLLAIDTVECGFLLLLKLIELGSSVTNPDQLTALHHSRIP